MNKELKKVVKKYKHCTDCPLHQTAHSHVFYRSNTGDALPEILFIGEAPGNTEDLTGKPFIGKAGDLLEHWISDAEDDICRDIQPLNFGGLAYGITNIVCCRPLDEDRKIRPPSKEEARACSERLGDMLEVLKPKVIILLGKVAESHYKMPGSLVGTPVLALQRPIDILRNGGVGSLSYVQNLVKLVDFLEANLYGEKESISIEAKSSEKVSTKEVAQKLAKEFYKKGQYSSQVESRKKRR